MTDESARGTFLCPACEATLQFSHVALSLQRLPWRNAGRMLCGRCGRTLTWSTEGGAVVIVEGDAGQEGGS